MAALVVGVAAQPVAADAPSAGVVTADSRRSMPPYEVGSGDVALDPLGRVIVAGQPHVECRELKSPPAPPPGGHECDEPAGPVMLRYSVSGERDLSFGGDGVVELPDVFHLVDVDAGGIVGVSSDQGDALLQLRRYTLDGEPDPSFAPPGIGTRSEDTAAPFLVVTSASRGLDGGYVVAGHERSTQSPPRFIAVFDGDGTPRQGFGDAGITWFGEDSVVPNPLGVLLADDGTLTIAGDVSVVRGQDHFGAPFATPAPAVARLSATGDVLAGFGTSGVVRLDHYEGRFETVVLDGAGRFLVGGWRMLVPLSPVGGVPPNRETLIASVTPDGLDPTFVVDGPTRGHTRGAGHMLVDHAGRVVVAGRGMTRSVNFAVTNIARYTPTGEGLALDRTFGLCGETVVGGTRERSAIHSLHLLPSGDVGVAYGSERVFHFENYGFSPGTSDLAFAVVRSSPAPATLRNRTGDGYWRIARDGGVLTGGDAAFCGSRGVEVDRPIVGGATNRGRTGYWLAADDGGVFSFGNARFHGSTGGTPLNQPVVGMAATPSGDGYWLVARDGGVFAFGDARFHGSTGGTPLNEPVVGMARTPSGDGYWLVARDGGVFAFGDARFHGSAGDIRLRRPVVDIAPWSDGGGYWLLASDGGIFTYGSAAFLGAAPERPAPAVAVAAAPLGQRYFVAYADGSTAHLPYASSGFAQFEPTPGLAEPVVDLIGG